MDVTNASSCIFQENGINIYYFNSVFYYLFWLFITEDVMLMILSSNSNQNDLNKTFNSEYCIKKLQIKLMKIFHIINNRFEQLFVMKFSSIYGE